MSPLPGRRVPVVTIGGFLGAGKTTLINHLLKHAGGRRIVVLVNDFGAINIDHALIETVEADRISLVNGCVCCSLNDDLVRKIAGLVRESPAPAHIVIEPSGIADPRALEGSLSSLEAAGMVRADARLQIIDAAGFDALPYLESELVIDQAADSDLIVLNKADIASSRQLADLRALLEVAAPFTARVEARHGDLSPDLVLGFSEGVAAPTRRRRGTPSAKAPHDHGQRYTTLSFETELRVDRVKFESFVRDLPGCSLRAKGILRFLEGARLFHLVGHRASLEAAPTGRTGEVSRLVVIGLAGKLDARALERGFKDTLIGARQG